VAELSACAQRRKLICRMHGHDSPDGYIVVKHPCTSPRGRPMALCWRNLLRSWGTQESGTMPDLSNRRLPDPHFIFSRPANEDNTMGLVGFRRRYLRFCAWWFMCFVWPVTFHVHLFSRATRDDRLLLTSRQCCKWTFCDWGWPGLNFSCE
jgi:hypothetical protein